MKGPYKQLLITGLLIFSLGSLAAADPGQIDGKPELSFFAFPAQLKIIGFLTIISLIPFGVMMMTSFTRISIIFQFLKNAIGSSQVPSNQIIMGLSLILTGFVMHPVIEKVQQEAFNPYIHGSFNSLPQVVDGSSSPEALFFKNAWKPLRAFLLQHTREKDLSLFIEISQSINETKNAKDSGISARSGASINLEELPWYCLIPSFITSELRTAFMMGFLIFLPFLIIDMVVSAVLMSLGIMMLPPVMISTPFKLLLFILMDGWRLIIQQIVTGFYPG